MPRGLLVLLQLRFFGWLRRLGRVLQTVRGALLVVVGVLVMIGWLLPSLYRGPGTPEELELARRFGPWLLLAFCLINLLFSSNERALTFNPAEVNFLFPAPVTRRQLLLYRIAGNFGAGVLTAVFMMLVLRRYSVLLFGGFLGALLIFTFMQFFSMALALLANIVGARAYSRRRRFLIVVFAALVGFVVFQQTQQANIADFAELFRRVEQSPVVRTLLTPVQWFVDVVTAERYWPDLAQYVALALAVNIAMLLVVLLLDAHFLEASAAASEKLYAMIQRMRRGGATAAPSSGTGKARLRLASLPFWGGVGPVAWRQLTTAVRSLRQLLFILFLCAMIFLPATLQFARSANPAFLLALTPGFLFVLTVFAPSMIPFDFRSDLDRMDVLKSLPLPAWRLVVGQLIAPIFLISLIQIIVLLAVQSIVGQFSPLLTSSAAFFVPLNTLFIALDNLMFLWFPTRNLAAAPGDFQMMGRMIIMWMAKMIALMVTLIPVAIAGVLGYFLSGENWVVTGVAAWAVMMIVVSAIIPVVAWAFRSFDVARDTAGM